MKKMKQGNKEIRIEVDRGSGFCTGVVRAVKKAEQYLQKEGRLYSLGELVHNPLEVERLRGLGLEPVTYEEFEDLENTDVLIRAHGEPPETYRKARDRNIRLIDATCPIVLNLQKKIRESYSAPDGKRGSILIYGKANHPEVRALLGQIGGQATVVTGQEQLDKLELNPPVVLFSQTTMNEGQFNALCDALRRTMVESGMDPGKELKVHHTICRQVASREGYLREFVAEYDLVFFVSGRESSNGRALFQVCREVNTNTHFISHPEESDRFDLNGVSTIGICGATSSPSWLLDELSVRLRDRLKITGS
jgi:4-hydroxy-3-methylbut-2-enyl diphosphate reductase